MKKRFLAVITTLCMVLSLLPVAAFATESDATPVAKVGETEYPSLQAAVDDAEEGSTVTLLSDASGAGVVIDKNITIDFNGKTYALTSGVGSTGTETNGFQLLQGNTVTLKNGTLQVAAENKDAFYILVQNYADLIVEDMTLDGTNLDKYSGTDGDSYTLSNNSGTVSITGETNIIANDEGDKAFAFDVCKYGSYTPPTVTIRTTGTISGNFEVSESLDNDNLIIQGGTYTQDVTKWVGPDLGMVQDSEGNWVLTEAVAEVNGTEYTSIAKAVNAANDGDTITVLAGSSLDETVVIDKDVTLDLGGYAVYANNAAVDPAFRIQADVTVKNGTVDARNDAAYAFILGKPDGTTGNLTIESGTYYGETSAVSVTKGTLTINGGTFKVDPWQEDNYNFLLNCIDANYKDGTASIVVKGGTFYNFDPANNAAEGAGTDFVADGYKSTQTADNTWTVEPNMEEVVAEVNGTYYTSLGAAAAAANDGDTVVLVQNTTVTSKDMISIPAKSNGNGKYGIESGNGAVFNVIGEDVTFDLNGHTITFEGHDPDFCNKCVESVFYVTDGGKLTIVDSSENGTGAVTVNGMATAVYSVAVNSQAIVEGGTWTGNPCDECDAYNLFLYASHGGELYIKDGSFSQNVDESYLIVKHGSSTPTTDNGAGVDYDETKVVVTGGTFTGMNPVEAWFCDEGTSQKTWSKTNVVADGYKSTQTADNTWTVSKIQTSSGGGSSDPSYKVNVDADGLKASATTAKSGATITLTVEDGYTVSNLKVLDKNGKEIEVTDKGDGTFTFKMPKGQVTVQADSSVIHNCPSEDFTDVDQELWYHEGIDYAIEQGLMNGTSSTTFEPGSTTTRGMIVTILYRLEGAPAAAASSFQDVADGQWYTDAVAWAAANGIVTGYDANTFGPMDPITREQMAAILYRYAAYKGYDVSQKADLSKYQDQSAIGAYAKDAMAWANAAGLITGITDTTLSPQGSAIRAQAATILMRFCESVVK